MVSWVGHEIQLRFTWFQRLAWIGNSKSGNPPRNAKLTFDIFWSFFLWVAPLSNAVIWLCSLRLSWVLWICNIIIHNTAWWWVQPATGFQPIPWDQKISQYYFQFALAGKVSRAGGQIPYVTLPKLSIDCQLIDISTSWY